MWRTNQDIVARSTACILFWKNTSADSGRLKCFRYRAHGYWDWHLFLWSDRFCHDSVKPAQRQRSMLVHPVKGDGNRALHLCSGDLRQVLGIEDEEVSWPLGARGRHNSQQHPWRTQHHLLQTYRIKCVCVCVFSLLPSSSSTPSGVWTNRGSEG